MRRQVEKGAILENDSVDLTVRIAFDYSDDTRDGQRLQGTQCAGAFGRSWFNFANSAPGRRVCDDVGFEQFLCFEMAVGADALFRPDHLDQLPRKVRRKFDHSTVIQQQPVNFATWIEEVLRDRAFHLRLERPLAEPVWPDPEFVFHFLYPVFGKADFAANYQDTRIPG
jgi:hypothetical protein